jgi:hypothetical protein
MSSPSSYVYNNNSGSLIPVRIDATSNDKSIRVIDTLLFDPSCWPVPLTSPLKESLEANVSQLAYTCLSDQEVHTMGKASRHFTGRVDLFSKALFETIEDQLRPQLWNILTNHTKPTITEPTNISIRLQLDGILIQEDFLWDPSVPVHPMEIAQSIVHDYNLPEDAVVAITVAILEQVHGGLKVDASDSPIEDTKPWRGAELIDTKNATADAEHLVQQHTTAK